MKIMISTKKNGYVVFSDVVHNEDAVVVEDRDDPVETARLLLEAVQDVESTHRQLAEEAKASGS